MLIVHDEVVSNLAPHNRNGDSSGDSRHESALNSADQPHAEAGAESPRPVKRVAVLGATGSIGTATIEVLQHLNQTDPEHRWQAWAVSGHQNLAALGEIVGALPQPPQRIILSDASHSDASTAVDFATAAEAIRVGSESLIEAAANPEVDIVVAAIVGRAGLESTVAAVDAGKRVAFANKETLVVAGPVVRRKMETSGAELLPVDSEHSAIFQCIGGESSRVRRLILTASGGPFRTWTKEQMDDASLDSALAHPTWEMGKKITIDSATMMNKALEIIEAKWLFDVPAEAIEVVVHPQSIVHSLVEFTDGSVLAQLSPPDMRLPIQYALTYPRRLPCIAPTLDRSASWDLSLQPVDHERFPAVELGFEVAASGGTSGAVVNAANEQAVGLFLDGQIRFTDIVPCCRKVLEHHTHETNPPLARLLELDRWARSEVQRACV